MNQTPPESDFPGKSGSDDFSDSPPTPKKSFAERRKATVILLGTGTSVGVPAIGCMCDVCQSDDPHNKRLRCAIAVEWQTELGRQTLLVDTPPDLRTQLLREKIPLAHAVLFTHEHADHIFGLDDVRLFPFRLGSAVPLYCQPPVEARIRQSFDYAFIEREETHPGARPRLEFRTIGTDPFEVLDVWVTPIPMRHGPHFEVLGFRIGDFAYCTDTNGVPRESIERLRGVKTLVLGALRYAPHPTHFSVEEAIEVAGQVGAEITYLTHVSHELDYATTNAALPPGVRLSYDGLRIDIELDR